MSNVNCSVFGCHNTPKNTATLDPKVHFYKFSTKLEQQQRVQTWTNFCRRKDINGKAWKSSKTSRICSRHFIGNEKMEHPLSPSYNPSIYPANRREDKILSKLKRYERVQKRQSERDAVARVMETDILPCVIHHEEILVQPMFVEIACQTENCDELECLSIFISATSNGEASSQVTHLAKYQNETKNAQVGQDSKSSVFCCMDSIRNDEKKLKVLTFVTLQVFSLLQSLLPNSAVQKNEISWENKLLLFLMKMRTNLTFTALSVMFDISTTTASNTFYTILFIVYDRTKSWIIWPSREAIEFTLPDSFKKNYSRCRVIIDCTEIKTEMPGSVEVQNNMYSNYKGTYTVKFLIGIAPSGLITFISKAFGGRSSDTHITTECGILDKLEPGDLVMADKGFPDIKMSNGTILVMPPFSSRGQKQFTGSQMEETYNVASVRIHVERAIQRLKIFNIMTNRLTIDLLPSIDKICHVCAILVNLQPPIINEKNIANK